MASEALESKYPGIQTQVLLRTQAWNIIQPIYLQILDRELKDLIHPVRLPISGIVIQIGLRTSGLNSFPVAVHVYDSYPLIK